MHAMICIVLLAGLVANYVQGDLVSADLDGERGQGAGFQSKDLELGRVLMASGEGGVLRQYQADSKRKGVGTTASRKLAAGLIKPSKALMGDMSSNTDHIIKKWVAQKSSSANETAGDTSGIEAFASMPDKIVVAQIEQSETELVNPEEMSMKPHSDAESNEDFDPLMNANKAQRASGKLYRISKVQVKQPVTSRRKAAERTGRVLVL